MKEKIGLIVEIAIVVILLVSCILLYWRTLTLQNDLDSALWDNHSLQITIEDLNSNLEELKEPRFYTIQVNWSVVEESSNHWRIDVQGIVFNAGTDSAITVTACPSFRIYEIIPKEYMGGITPSNFTISDFPDTGIFQGRSSRSFSQSFYSSDSRVWNITAIEITYHYSTTF
jgi:hypothetical protein